MFQQLITRTGSSVSLMLLMMNQSSNDNWNQEPGDYGSQQQQPPQQQPYTGPQGVPPRKKSNTPIIIGIIALVAIIGIVVAVLMFTGGSSLEGRWNADYTSVEGRGGDYTEDIDGWIEFNSDGTGRSFMDGVHGTFEWENLGDGKLRITDDDYGTSTEFDYKISGSTLTLEYSEMGMSMKMVFQRA